MSGSHGAALVVPSPEDYGARLAALVSVHGDLQRGAKALVRELSEAERARLQALVDATCYSRRRYPGGQSFCWPQHPAFLARPVDPWPASRFPAAVLMAEFAQRVPPS